MCVVEGVGGRGRKEQWRTGTSDTVTCNYLVSNKKDNNLEAVTRKPSVQNCIL